jgi:DNA-3-methyladenine glycosylase II
MGISADALRRGLDELATRESGFARALAIAGYPEPRIRERGHATLLRTIVGQQVSVAAAASMWAKFEGVAGADMDPGPILAADFDTLRACGLSRQKQGYIRSL